MIFRSIKTPIFLITVGLVSLPQSAFAGEIQDQIKACGVALENSKADIMVNGEDGIKFRFKSIHGSTLKRLKFSTKIDGERVLVTCHIKRKKVRKLTYKNGKVFGDFHPEK